MKSIIYWVLIISALGCSEKKKLGYSISGNLKQLEDGQAFLVKLNLADNSTQYLDTAIIKNEKFEFSGELKHPYPHTIYLNTKENKIHLFLDNSKVIINGSIDNLDDIKVSGSREDSLFRPWFNNSMFEFDPDLDIIFNKSDYYLAPFIAFYHIQSYPTSLDSMQLMLNQFKGEIKNSPYYTALEELVNQSAKTAIGQIAPDFNLPDTLGRIVSLKSFNSELILIDFWASWCKPCRAANPTLVSIYKKYKNQGLEIIGISVDENRKKWIKAINKDNLSWPQLSELKGWETQVTKDYAIKAVPQNFLLDKNGAVLAKNIEPEKLDEIIKSYISE